MCNSLFIDEGLLSIISASCGKLVKMLKSLEVHGKFDYLYILLILVGIITKKLKKIFKETILVRPGFEPLRQAGGLQESVLDHLVIEPQGSFIKTKIPTNEKVYCFKSLRCCICHANKC